MQRQILVPLDGSALSETILPHTLRLAHATHSTLILLRVVSPPALVDPLVGVVPAAASTYDTWDSDSSAAKDYLARLAARVEDEQLPVRTVVLEGEPATAIIGYAMEHTEGLIIAMATHGRSGLRRWVFGSVAERVLHATPVPLLLARPFLGAARQGAVGVPAYQRLLVPLDGSPLAEQALKPARQLAAALDSTVRLVAAVPGHDNHISAEQAAAQEALGRYLATTAAGFEAGGLRAETQILYGHPAEAILRDSASAPDDLIVMTTHGRSGLQQLWLGSVAIKVVQGAQCPVLLIRAQAVAQRVKEPVAAPAGRLLTFGAF